MSKKIIGVTLVVMALALAMSVVVSASAIEPIREWKGATLLDRPGGAGSDEESQTKYMRYGDHTGDHPIWGVETDPIETEGNSFTIVFEVKIGEDDGSTPDSSSVFAFDPKIRAVDDTGSIIAEPVDQPFPITAAKLLDAEKDADGFALFYYVLTPEVYGNNDKIKIENRVRYFGIINETNHNRIGIDIRYIAVYRGDVVEELTGQDPIDTDPVDTDPVDTDPQDTSPTTHDSYSHILFALFGILLTPAFGTYLLKKSNR